MRTIAICGFDTASRDLANEQPESVELWGINNARTFITGPIARTYQIHPKDWKNNQGMEAGTYGRGKGYVEALANEEGSVYLAEPDDRIPKGLIFPAEEIMAHFPHRYFTSTPAWMVAHAIYEHDKAKFKRDKIKEIRIFGITLSTTHEYFGQRPCLEWLCGHAEARKINVVIPDMSTLFKGPLYPFSDLGGDLQNMRQMAQQRVNGWRTKNMESRDAAIAMTAVASCLQTLTAAIQQGDGKPVDLDKTYERTKTAAQQLLNEGNQHHSSFREAQNSLLMLGSADLPPVDTPAMDVQAAHNTGNIPIAYGEVPEAEVEEATDSESVAVG